MTRGQRIRAGYVVAGAILLGLLGLALGGCASLDYYSQSVGGHLKLMAAARPVSELVQDEATPQDLRNRLALSQRMRDFAARELHLPDNASYRRYADLQRPAVVWNVVAAPALSLQLQSWCFPVAGCVNYRGYFALADAQQLAGDLRKQGLDVEVYPVPAYSTLGWMNWMGGDPLLNTFIHYPEGELARLMFHELAHQVVYVDDDSMFNESFATAVERLGSSLWLATHALPQARGEAAVLERRRQQFRALVHDTRDQLARLYADAGETEALAGKTRQLEQFRARYEELKKSWGGYAGYDARVRNANNAMFGAFSTYDELVPGFEALFAREAGDWPRFFESVRSLASRPKEERRQRLQQWALDQRRVSIDAIR